MKIYLYTHACVYAHTHIHCDICHQTGIVVDLLGFLKYLFYLSTHLFIWLDRVFVVAQDLHCVMWDHSLWCTDSLVVVRGLVALQHMGS